MFFAVFLKKIQEVTLRRWVQLVSLILANAYVIQALRFIPCGVLNCSNCSWSTFTCPLILLQRGAIFISMGMFGMMSAKILGSIIVALATLFLLGALLGTWLCGWLCPFGYVQDLLHKIPTKKFFLPFWAGWGRLPLFVLLVAIVPYYTRQLFFCDICPPGTVTRLSQQAAGLPLFIKSPEGVMAIVSVAILVAVLLTALFVSRPFCTLLCPIGGIYGILNKVSGFKLSVDHSKCTGCNVCSRHCPQGLAPYETPNHSHCTRCLNCTNKCDAIYSDVRM
jgi:ferredoxin-type protein NapH